MIKVKRAGKNFGNRSVINDCSLTIDKGEIYALVGVNGTGKTTLMKMAAGSVAFRKMEVWIKNMEVK
ncbi:ATP-binding cassette domain-containing protein [[Clostridium] scindens]|uniref:ATP-binding cassette domain-containing protein n=1 Tax=Clostridium scindens (strain JCM 10418 / VPI 12708) TaxID=29347 RepID=UPI003AB6C93E